MQGLAVLAVIGGVVTTVLWLVIGWRAMRAHERIADAVEKTATKFREGDK